MAQQPEAECLLATGAMYSRRIGLKPAEGDLIFAGQKRGAFSLYFGDAPIYHFDLEGRWQRIFHRGIHFRKGLDNSVAAIDRVREGKGLVLHRGLLDDAEVADLDEMVRLASLDLLTGVRAGTLRPVHPPEGVHPMGGDRLASILARIGSWDAATWASHRKHYVAAYEAIGFLPPDAHQSIVVQASGKTPQAFGSHLREVKALWGARSLQANLVFLGGDDALRLPRGQLAAMFDAIHATFPIRRDPTPTKRRKLPEDEVSLEGIDALVSDFGPGLPDREALKSLAGKGLRRVNLWPAIGRGPEGLRDFVEDLKATGLSVAVMVPMHTPIAEFTDSILPLPLGSGDLVYLILSEGGPALQDEQSNGLISACELLKERRVKVVPYSMGKQRN